MKKIILAAIISLTFTATQSFGLGVILMDNYNSFNQNGGPVITYGPGGAGPAGTGLGSTWTAGLYYALGDVRGSIAHDFAGYADPSTLGGGLTLALGPGSTAQFDVFGTAGEFAASQTFQINDNPGDTITAMVVAYDGADYSTSLNRGHSDAFIMTTSVINDPSPHLVGDYMPGFSVPIPEPATLVFAGLGLAGVLALRRKTA